MEDAKASLCIQMAGAEGLEAQLRKIWVQMLVWFDERWRRFAVFAGLAVRFLGWRWVAVEFGRKNSGEFPMGRLFRLECGHSL